MQSIISRYVFLFAYRRLARVVKVISHLIPPSRRYGRKLAVTDRAALMVTVQVVPETVSQPLQPLKTERKPGVAVRVTTVPLL